MKIWTLIEINENNEPEISLYENKDDAIASFNDLVEYGGFEKNNEDDFHVSDDQGYHVILEEKVVFKGN